MKVISKINYLIDVWLKSFYNSARSYIPIELEKTKVVYQFRINDSILKDDWNLLEYVIYAIWYFEGIERSPIKLFGG